MRTILICFTLLVLSFIGYAYSKNPAGCWKIVDDFGALVTSIAPGQVALPPVGSTTPATNTDTAPVPPPASATEEIIAPPAPPAPGPLKKWTPPNPLPAQANWTWTTLSGKTYDNVVITSVSPDSVSITYAEGAATLPLVLLPPDLQKQLNYDPDAAAAAKAESDREQAHPYYRLGSLAQAQAVARQLQWPLAWMDSSLSAPSVLEPTPGSAEDLTQMAINHLKSRAVIILLDGDNDLPALSPIIRDQQLFQFDDGPLPDGHHFYAPKIVFSDANVTKALGRVSSTQMKASREAAIDMALTSIANDPSAQALLSEPPPSTPSSPSP
jgi:hypothetical protein